MDYKGEKARAVLKLDDELDAMHRSVRIVDEEPGKASGFLPFLSISRNLERIADLATNIAEDVIYLVDGDIVRHQHAE